MSGRETAQQRAAGAAGGGGHRLADHVGAGSEQDPGGQVVAQKEDAPGVDAALGDLGQGEDDEEHQEAVPLQPADGVGGAGVLAVGADADRWHVRFGGQRPHADRQRHGGDAGPDPAP